MVPRDRKLTLILIAEARDLAARVEPIIEAHERGPFVAAVIEAGARYGQYRQLGRTHQDAADTVVAFVHSWYTKGH